MITKQHAVQTLYWICIFIVSISMVVYGVAKPFQFESFDKTSNLNVSEGHKIMWTFYSYTKAYPIIIGIFEVIGGVSLLFNRTRIFGCFILITILVNIILQDYFYEIVALNSAIFYLILVFIILIIDFKKVRVILTELFKSARKRNNYLIVIIAFLIACVIKFYETRMI